MAIDAPDPVAAFAPTETAGSADGPVHVSRDLSLLAFNLGEPEQPPAVSGIDVVVVRTDASPSCTRS
jgi:hypothetical protein